MENFISNLLSTVAAAAILGIVRHLYTRIKESNIYTKISLTFFFSLAAGIGTLCFAFLIEGPLWLKIYMFVCAGIDFFYVCKGFLSAIKYIERADTAIERATETINTITETFPNNEPDKHS